MEEYHTNDDGEKEKEHEMLMYKYVINEKVQEKEQRHPNKCEFCQSILWCKISELKKHIFYCEKNPTNMRKNIQKKSAEILNEAINKALNNRDQMSEMNPSQLENLKNHLDNTTPVPKNSPVKSNSLNEGIKSPIAVGIQKEGINFMELPELENRETLTFINASAIEELKAEPIEDTEEQPQSWKSTNTKAKCGLCDKYFSHVGYLTRHLNSENHRHMLVMKQMEDNISENQNVVPAARKMRKILPKMTSNTSRDLELRKILPTIEAFQSPVIGVEKGNSTMPANFMKKTTNAINFCKLCQKSFTHKKNYLKHMNFFCKARIMEENLCHLYKHKDFKQFGFIHNLTTNLVTCDDPEGSDILKTDFNLDDLVKSGVLTKIGEMITTKTFKEETI